MNVLVSSAGRRGALIRLLRDAVAPYGGRVYATDAGAWSAACRLADGWSRVPRCDDPAFVEATLAICRRHEIQLLIPTIDTELPVFAQHREAFLRQGVHVAISGVGTVAVAYDKLATDEFLVAAGLPTVRRFDPATVAARDDLAFPLIVKPRFGSASKGVQRVQDREELTFFLKRTEFPLVQEVAQGREYTINFFVDRHRQLLTATPHRRVETRGGEVSKCVTEKQPELMATADRLAQMLPDAWGPLCFQAFLDEAGGVKIIEINARLGGGYPIAHQAGANFLAYLIDDALGKPLPASPNNSWRAGLAMTRWDDAVFLSPEDLQACA